MKKQNINNRIQTKHKKNSHFHADGIHDASCPGRGHKLHGSSDQKCHSKQTKIWDRDLF